MSENKHLENVENNLTTLINQKAAALPRDFNQTRFIQNCLTVLQETKEIEKVQPVTIAKTLLKGAFLGLDFFTKECYAIPYANQLNFQTDYKGEMKLAKKYSVKPVLEVYAKLIKDGDLFEEKIIEGKQVINFTPKGLNDGDIKGAFAVANFSDGSMIYEVMSLKEMTDVKNNYAKTNKEGKYSKAWRLSPGEMYKKTVLRRLCKMIELDFETAEQCKAFQDASDFDVNKTAQTPQIENAFAKSAEVIDAEYTEIPKNEGYSMCSNCNISIDKTVNEFSNKFYSRPLCRECQKLAKEGQI